MSKLDNYACVVLIPCIRAGLRKVPAFFSCLRPKSSLLQRSGIGIHSLRLGEITNQRAKPIKFTRGGEGEIGVDKPSGIISA